MRNRREKSWVAKAKAMPRKVLTEVVVQVKKRYQQLKNRYGPRYTYVMVGAAFFTFFLPIPGISLVGVALVVVIAEVHRAISRRGKFSKTIAKESVMSINCDVIMKPSATPAQLTVLGAALWRWCAGAAGNNRIYQYVDSQSLADLIAGKFPASSQGGPSGVHFMARDEVSINRQASIASLRRDIPSQGVVDIVVDGTSWDLPGVLV